MAGTAGGVIATTPPTSRFPPPNGTIFDRLDAHGISWRDYYEEVPSPLIIPRSSSALPRASSSTIDQFFADAAAGTLPQFSFVDPDYETTSEENPQDIQVGEGFAAPGHHGAHAVAGLGAHRAVLHLRRARRLLRPRAAAARRSSPTPSRRGSARATLPGGYDRYGFRVPIVVVSP